MPYLGYMQEILIVGFLLGGVVVASNPSPYFGAMGLVITATMACGVTVLHGGGFLGLVLILIYLGGMLVIFAYSSAMASDLHPESWGNPRVAMSSSIYVGGVLGALWLFLEDFHEGVLNKVGEGSVVLGDQSGVALLFSSGGWGLVVGGWVLLLALFAVLEVVRGGSRGALRAV